MFCLLMICVMYVITICSKLCLCKQPILFKIMRISEWSRVHTVVETAVTTLLKMCKAKTHIMFLTKVCTAGLWLCAYVGSITPCSQPLNYEPNAAGHFNTLRLCVANYN